MFFDGQSSGGGTNAVSNEEEEEAKLLDVVKISVKEMVMNMLQDHLKL